MKIAITGHTKGIGKSIYDLLSQKHEVLGFSRSNGYDITKFYDVIVAKTLTFDVFINNTYVNNFQNLIFTKLLESWKLDETKTIVNIGSRAMYTQFSGVYSQYAIHKKQLHDECIKNVFSGLVDKKRCRVITISPGQLVNDQDCLKPEDVAKVVEFALNMPQHIELGDIGIWSTKYKKFNVPISN